MAKIKPQARPIAQDELAARVIEQALIVAHDLARARHTGGALIVLAPPDALKGRYAEHYPHVNAKGTLLDAGMGTLIERLATIDGAILLTPRGEVLTYGARLLPQRTFPGFGTRHAAARGISAATLGLAPVAILVIGGAYVVVRTAFTTLSGAFKRMDDDAPNS